MVLGVSDIVNIRYFGSEFCLSKTLHSLSFIVHLNVPVFHRIFVESYIPGVARLFKLRAILNNFECSWGRKYTDVEIMRNGCYIQFQLIKRSLFEIFFWCVPFGHLYFSYFSCITS
jgi:hypothetical protein